MYYTVIKHSRHFRTLAKRRKHSPAARVFYISLLFSNTCRVLSQCNTLLRLFYLLDIAVFIRFQSEKNSFIACFFCYKVLARRPNGVWAARFPIEYKVRICQKHEILQIGTRFHNFSVCSRFDCIS